MKILAEKETSILVKRQAVFTTALLQQDLLACNTQNEPVAVAIAAEKRCTRCLGALQVQNVFAIHNRCKMLRLQLQHTKGAKVLFGAWGAFRMEEVLFRYNG